MRLLRADGQLIRVGHRGAARLAPENTVRSFEVAVEHGVDAIEFDVLDAGPASARTCVGHALAELGPRSETRSTMRWTSSRGATSSSTST